MSANVSNSTDQSIIHSSGTQKEMPKIHISDLLSKETHYHIEASPTVWDWPDFRRTGNFSRTFLPFLLFKLVLKYIGAVWLKLEHFNLTLYHMPGNVHDIW